MSHNKILTTLLQELKTMVKNAQSEADFKPVFEKLKAFQSSVGPIKYDHTAKLWWLVGFALCAGICALVYFLVPMLERDVAEYLIWAIGVCGFASLAPIIMILSANEDIENISDRIFWKDIYFDNKLNVVSVKGQKSALYKDLHRQFGEFHNRGDESRYIEKMVRGVHTGTEIALEYTYYVFHYVRVYYVPVTRTIGKTTTIVMERRTETLYRYGIIADFDYAKGVAVISGGGSYNYPNRWETSSENFNNTFSVYAETEIAAARFLKPTVILAFNELRRFFSDLNVEITRDGKLNIAFGNSDVLSLERKHSIASPVEFEAEIKSHLALPKLDKLMQFIETLKRFNDNNFEETAPVAEQSSTVHSATAKGELA